MVAESVKVFDELAQFLASLSPTKILAYRSSKKSQERVNFLLAKSKESGLTSEENAEMEKFMMIEHLVQLAKAKALVNLAKE